MTQKHKYPKVIDWEDIMIRTASKPSNKEYEFAFRGDSKKHDEIAKCCAEIYKKSINVNVKLTSRLSRAEEIIKKHDAPRELIMKITGLETRQAHYTHKYKRCTICGKEFPRTEQYFFRNKGKYFTPACKKCHNKSK